jgi:hypothetical protein
MSVADLERFSYAPRLPSARGLGRHMRLALVAAWRAGELDRQLAAGASPDASALLAIRARRLMSRAHRARVAAGLARAVRDANATRPGLSAAVRPDAREVIAAGAVLATLQARLRADEPVTPRGVALLESLLADGTSELYRPTETGALGSRLRAAAAALEPLARPDPVGVRQSVAR